MGKLVKSIVIVGGGTAGWLTAGTLAAAHAQGRGRNLSITLVESPTVKILGVGEGTWPSMRDTLKTMGIAEVDFIRHCDASFKQGSCFVGWQSGARESYYHPFTLPEAWGEMNLARIWPAFRDQVAFAEAVCPQSLVCDNQLAPKEVSTPEYDYLLNYGYHLDAGKFAAFLKCHCCDLLGVQYISADVAAIEADDNGYITALKTNDAGNIEGDLFIDCSGFAALLLGQHYQVPFIHKNDVLFNDTALAVQVPYKDAASPIKSYTQSTAQSSGWIWDIGLQSRRGIGHVYSSRFTTEAEAEQVLLAYLQATDSPEAQTDIRKISFTPGYREKFWVKNCVAVGVSAGFIEPLEASALVMIELAAKMLAEQMPVSFDMMLPLAKRYNDKFSYHWQRVIEFLKLHYVLSSRTDSVYWQENKNPSSIPESLQDLLCLWRYQPPWAYDCPQREELFSSASFQYVLYGMGFPPDVVAGYQKPGNKELQLAQHYFEKNAKQTRRLLGRLPGHRELLMHLSKINHHAGIVKQLLN